MPIAIKTPHRATTYFNTLPEYATLKTLCMEQPALLKLVQEVLQPSKERYYNRYKQYKTELANVLNIDACTYQDILYKIDSLIKYSTIPTRSLSYKLSYPVHIVNVSGGLTSFEALRRTIQKYGIEHTHPVFADTLGEHKDLYRFLEAQEAYFDIKIDFVCEGRTTWEVFEDRKCMKLPAVHNMATCSQELKREVIDYAVRNTYTHGQYTHVAGLDWSELHRVDDFIRAHKGMPCNFPLLDKPLVDKEEIGAFCEQEGIPIPTLYKQGFTHNNCNAECVKGGQAHWALKLKVDPMGYRQSELQEEHFIQTLGKNRTILRVQRANIKQPITLKAFREQLETTGKYDTSDWGACGCYAPYTA